MLLLWFIWNWWIELKTDEKGWTEPRSDEALFLQLQAQSLLFQEEIVRNIAMVIGYDGTGYSGFQTQPSGNTIQNKLEEAISHLTGEGVKIHGSGRTDAGVHARAQVIHFLTESRIPIERWSLALNTRLPPDIMVYTAWEASPDFHARRSAKRKTYRYSIQRSKYPDIFNSRTRFHHPLALDTDAMRSALNQLQGKHDFTSFCTVRTAMESKVRILYDTRLEFVSEPLPGDEQAGVIHIDITGNGFLYNMVRIIVGTLIDIGQGKRKSSDMGVILEAKDRGKAGPTAVAHGLTLWRVEY